MRDAMLKRYLDILEALSLEAESAPGDLTEAFLTLSEEADELWWDLTEEEQSEVERRVKNPPAGVLHPFDE